MTLPAAPPRSSECSGPEEEASRLAYLRSVRNSVIGSRTRKSRIVSEGRIPEFVELLSAPLTHSAALEVRGLAATILGSIAHGATPPTLLTLLKARTDSALLQSLEDVTALLPTHFSTTGDSSSSTVDLLSDSAAPLKLLESLLRALRALLVAVADEVAAGSRWGIGSGWGVGMGWKGNMAMGRSVREKTGWDLAGVGQATGTELNKGKEPANVDAGGDAQMRAASMDDLRARANLDATSKEDFDPAAVLRFLSRSAISSAFHPSNLRLLLGPLFIARVPQHANLHITSAAGAPSLSANKLGSAASLRSETRPGSPAGRELPARNPGLRGATLSRSSSHMSLASANGEGSGKGMGDTAQAASLELPLATRARLLSIVEMVCAVLASCISVPGPEHTVGEGQPELGPASAEEELHLRRERVLGFTAQQTELSGTAAVEHETDTMLSGLAPKLQAELVHGAGAGRYETEQERQRGVLDVLLEAAGSGYTKTQEAALWALAELVRDNSEAGIQLFRCETRSGMLPTSLLLSLRKEPSAAVRLAAFCCLAHIMKVHPFTPKTNECVLSVLIELLDHPGEIQVQATFAIARLVSDDAELQVLACDTYDCMKKLAGLLEKSNAAASSSYVLRTETVPSRTEENVIVDETLIRLREGTFTALAALTFQRDELRRMLADSSSPALLPFVVPSLAAGALGIRIAACRLVRALSRSVSILRTSLVDAGVADQLLAILQDKNEHEAVKTEATATLCNLVLKFAPMKQLLIDAGGIKTLVELAHSGQGLIRLNALWALKNVLYSSETDVKQSVMSILGWDYLASLARDSDATMQEQALNIIRNLASSREADIELTLNGLGEQRLFEIVEEVVWARTRDNLTEQAAYILVNIATGSDAHRRAILNRPNLVDALLYFTNHPRADVRQAGVWGALNLTFRHSTSERRRQTPDVAAEAVSRLRNFGFEKRLLELRDDPALDVRDRAKTALERFATG